MYCVHYGKAILSVSGSVNDTDQNRHSVSLPKVDVECKPENLRGRVGGSHITPQTLILTTLKVIQVIVQSFEIIMLPSLSRVSTLCVHAQTSSLETTILASETSAAFETT